MREFMVNEELVANIRNRFQQGERRNEIRMSLMEEGWEEADVDNAISFIQNEALKQLPGISHIYKFIDHLDSKTSHSSPKVIAAVLAGCFGVLLIIFGGLYYFLDPLGFGGVERDKQREADIVKIRSAIDKYQVDKSVYPSTLQELLPKYLQAIPQDPETGGQYSYQTMDNNYNYELCVNFESKAPQCVSSSIDTSDIPMVIATPTPAATDTVTLPVEPDASAPAELEEAPIVTIVPEVTGEGSLAL